jgi:hypothetical protein
MRWAGGKPGLMACPLQARRRNLEVFPPYPKGDELRKDRYG